MSGEHSASVVVEMPGQYSLSVQSGHFNSIKGPLEWSNIPPLAILTGLNGTGKSQLLRSIGMTYDNNIRRNFNNPDVQLKIEGLSCKPHEVLFLDNFASPLSAAPSGVAQLAKVIGEHRGGGDTQDVYEREIRTLLRQNDGITNTNIHEAFYRNPKLLERAVTHHCVTFGTNRAKAAENLYDSGEQGVDLSSLVGTPPWEEINEWFEESGFPYRLNKPNDADFTAQFRLTMRREGYNDKILLSALSSGEASIVRFIFMMYAVSQKLLWIRLLILDEPDSHLHASLISSFLRLLQRLVDQHETRVIMSTHRMETIGFAPPGSVFIMHREYPRIRPCDDKVRTIGMLSGNLFGMILADKRPVFVRGP